MRDQGDEQEESKEKSPDNNDLSALILNFIHSLGCIYPEQCFPALPAGSCVFPGQNKSSTLQN